MTEIKGNKSILLLFFGGLITLIVNLFISYYQENKKIEMENIQFESSLIINAIDKNDIESSKKNIKFLIESGLISNKNRKILPLLTDSTFSIKFPREDTIFIEPKNQWEIGNSFIKSVYSAQIIDENDKPLEGVEITTHSYTEDNKRINGSFFAKTTSDKNGLFKISIPGGRYSMSIQKEGYLGRNTIYTNDKMIRPGRIKIYKKRGGKDIFQY